MFIKTITQSAREKVDKQGHFYHQNDEESHHAVKQFIQNYKKEDVIVVLKNLEQLSDRQDTEEVRALYGVESFTVDEPYKTFLVHSNE